MTDAPAARPARHWFRFSLRTLLLLAPLITIVLALVGQRWYEKRQLAWAVETIEKRGGVIQRDKQQRITHVQFSGRALDNASLEETLSALERLPHLESLMLSGASITDEGLAHLERLPRLKSVFLFGTKTTPQGIAKLQQRRPGLMIDTVTPNPRAMKLAQRPIFNHAIVALAIALDGTLVSGSGDGRVRLWDLQQTLPAADFAAHSEWAFSIAKHPRRPLLATGGGDGQIKLWKWQTGEELSRWSANPDDVHAIAFTPDGKTLVSAGDDMVVHIWDLPRRRERFALSGHAGTIPALAISPDGKLVASASRDDTIRLWDIATGEHVSLLEGHTNDVLSLDFHPNGEELASASYDGTIKVWEVKRSHASLSGSGARLRSTSPKHGDWVFGVRYSPDGRHLMSTAGDGSRLWRREKLELLWHEDQRTVMSVPLWLDNQRVALASADGSISIRNLSGALEGRKHWTKLGL